MAAASPTFPTSWETTNYARLCVLLVDVGSQVLKETFDRIRPRGRLDTVLGTPPTSDTLKSLLKRKVLNPSQWRILYPATKSSVSSEKFDITLLMVLLRNICRLIPPAAGWDALPSPTDVNCEDDLARIKYYRNTVYGHAAQASVDDANFNNYWMKIRDTLLRLGGVKYDAAIDGVKNDCMDPEMEEYYIEMLKQWKVDEDVIGDKLNNVEAKVDNVQASVDRIETQLLQKSVATNVVINIENITLQGRVINIRDLADSCRMYQADGRSGEMKIILITQEEQEQAEGVEGTVSGQSQVYQQYAYVPTENYLWDVVLSVRNRLCAFYNHLQYGLRVLVRGYHLGSLTITVECSSLQTLEGLWNDYTNGHLEEVAQEALVTSDVLKTLGIAGMKLKTFISEEEYEKGKKELVENLGQPDTEPSNNVTAEDEASSVREERHDKATDRECDEDPFTSDEANKERALAVRSSVFDHLTSKVYDAKQIVHRLQETLEWNQASLEQPNREAKKWIRSLTREARRSERLDVVKYLREITPAGTTGPLLPETLDVRSIPFTQKRQLSVSLTVASDDKWKHVAEKLGLNQDEIRFLDLRLNNPVEALLCFRSLNVGELYNILCECGIPVIADKL